MTCSDVRGELAAAALTHTDPPAEVRAHLDVCAGCRGEAEELAAVTALLAHADWAAVPVDREDPGADDAHVVRLVDAAARRQQRQRRRWAVGMASAAAAAALVATPVTWYAASQTSGSTRPPVTAVTLDRQATDPVTGAWARVRLTATGTGGTTVALDVSGIATGTTCTVAVATRDGTRHDLLTWIVAAPTRYGGAGSAAAAGTIAATTPVPLGQVSDVTFSDPSGRMLLTVPVST